MEQISKYMITRTVLTAVGLAIAIYFTRSLFWGIAAIVLARTAVLSGYDIRGRTHDLTESSQVVFDNDALKPRWAPRVQRALLGVSLPLGNIAVLVSRNSSIPRYFIQRALGERALGIFSALAFMLAAGSMAVVSLGQSAFTRLAKFYATNDLVEFRALLGKLLAMGPTLGICGIIVAKVAGRELLTILFRPQYSQTAPFLPSFLGAPPPHYL